MGNNSLVGKIYQWGFSPAYDDNTVLEWGAGLLGVLILAFLWSLVVRQTMS